MKLSRSTYVIGLVTVVAIAVAVVLVMRAGTPQQFEAKGGAKVNAAEEPITEAHLARYAKVASLDGCLARKGSQHECIKAVSVHGLLREGPIYSEAIEAFSERGGMALIGEGKCHVIMHEVANAYGTRAGVTPANLGRHLPLDDGFDCTAGITHGLLIVAMRDATTTSSLKGLTQACMRYPTRIGELICLHGLGHGFMGIAKGDRNMALAMCEQLGANVAADCGPGVFHDYYLGTLGAGKQDGTRALSASEREPRARCADVEDRYLDACWRLSVMFTPTPFATTPAGMARQLLERCGDLEGAQRAGCIHGHSAVGIRSPELLHACSERVLSTQDGQLCLRGQIADPRNVPALKDCTARRSDLVQFCLQWWGRLHATYADDPADRSFCRQLSRPGHRAACMQGAARAGETLGML